MQNVTLRCAAAFAFLTAAVFGSDNVSSGVVARLCEHVKARKMFLVDTSQSEVIWSDGAVFEMAKSFPSGVQELITTSTSKRELRPAVTRWYTAQKTDYQDGKIGRSSGGNTTVTSADGKVTLKVATPYMDYLKERYPRARIRVKSEMDPILFMVDDTVRGAVMAIRSSSPVTEKGRK